MRCLCQVSPVFAVGATLSGGWGVCHQVRMVGHILDYCPTTIIQEKQIYAPEQESTAGHSIDN